MYSPILVAVSEFTTVNGLTGLTGVNYFYIVLIINNLNKLKMIEIPEFHEVTFMIYREKFSHTRTLEARYKQHAVKIEYVKARDLQCKNNAYQLLLSDIGLFAITHAGSTVAAPERPDGWYWGIVGINEHPRPLWWSNETGHFTIVRPSTGAVPVVVYSPETVDGIKPIEP